MTGNLASSQSPLAPPMPMRTIERTAAWHARDLGDPGVFTHRLTGDEVAEIDAAVQAIIDRVVSVSVMALTGSAVQGKALGRARWLLGVPEDQLPILGNRQTAARQELADA